MNSGGDVVMSQVLPFMDIMEMSPLNFTRYCLGRDGGSPTIGEVLQDSGLLGKYFFPGRYFFCWVDMFFSG